MQRKSHMDTFGAVSLVIFAFALAFNQVVIKVTNGGFGPIFAAGLRSVLALCVVLVWMAWRGKKLDFSMATGRGGILAGLFFSFEFICLYTALDLGSVARVSVIFYSMPVWLALVAHFLLPGERLTPLRSLGLALAMGGVVFALSDRQAGTAPLIADLAALGAALGWGAIPLVLRLTRLSELEPEMQLVWQLVISAIVLLAVAPLFGPLLRDPEPLHWAGLVFQSVAVASLGFLFWFWLLTIYPASSVAAFSFLSPVLSVFLGWLLLGERAGPVIYLALGLVVAGLILINRKPSQVPQKVR